MKKRYCLWIGLIFAVLSTSGILAQDRVPTKEELKRQQLELAGKCNAMLDKMLGSWTCKSMKDGKETVSNITFKRVVQNHFIQGDLQVTGADGKILEQKMFIITYSWGVRQYLFYSFESTGWAKQFIGDVSTEYLMIQGYLPGKGMEYYKWFTNEKNELICDYWAPVEGEDARKNPPDSSLIFTRTATTS